MATIKRNNNNQDYTNNADGFDIAGGTTKRKLTVSSGDVTMVGGTGATYAYPISSATLWGDNRIKMVTLSVDAAFNATTTGVEILGLNTPLGVGTYWIQLFIRYFTANATNGVDFGINHTGTSTLMVTSRIPTDGTTTIANANHDQVTTTTPTIMGANTTRTKSTTAPNLGPWAGSDSASTENMVCMDIYLDVTVAGDLELWHASEGAVSSIVEKGTTFIIYKVL